MIYIHRNPVKQALCERPEDWKWSSFLHYATGKKDAWKSNPNGLQENENEQQEDSARNRTAPLKPKKA